jgi:hypothetical protein
MTDRAHDELTLLRRLDGLAEILPALGRGRGATLDLLGAELRDPLTPVERRVLESIEPQTWDRMADLLDPRLQKIRLRSDA